MLIGKNFNRIVMNKLNRLKDFDEEIKYYTINYTSCDAQQWGEQYYSEWHRFIDINKRNALFECVKYKEYDNIAMYCGWSYRDVNEYLRNNSFNRHSCIQTTLDIIETLDQTLENSMLSDNIILTRWINSRFLPKNCLNQISIKNMRKLKDAAFKSCSAYLYYNYDANANIRVANGESLLVIKAKAGTPAIYLNHISERAFEQEVLLHRKVDIIPEKIIYRRGWNSIIICSVSS